MRERRREEGEPVLGGIKLFVFLEENTHKAVWATGNLSENHAVLCCSLSPRACTPPLFHMCRNILRTCLFLHQSISTSGADPTENNPIALSVLSPASVIAPVSEEALCLFKDLTHLCFLHWRKDDPSRDTFWYPRAPLTAGGMSGSSPPLGSCIGCSPAWISGPAPPPGPF